MSTERVGIYVEVRGADSALDKLRALDDIINRLNNKKINIDLGSAGQIKGLVNATENARKYSREVEVADRNTKTLRDTMRTTFNSVSSRMMHTGQQMQVLGKTLTQISTPFRTLMRSTLFASGFKVLNSVTEGISKGFSRYDTMKKYPKVMQAFGYSADQAQKSIDKLDLSVRGLPTGLDEMVDMAQRFTATTGNIEKGTDLAIAANNAFLASMSTDTQKYQGMMQLQDVLGGKDMNAREWNSLVSSMTPAIVKMGESLGYTSKNMSEWIQKVRDGKVSNEDFIDTLIKVGTEGGEVAKMAENSKDTWQAFFANVGNATSRMTAGIIKALDEVSQVVAGKDLNRLFSDTIIPGIDNLAKSVQDWIRANPDVIIDFFNTLKSFDFQGMFRGAGAGLLKTAQDYLELFKLFTGKDGSKFGYFMARAGFYGKAFNLVGGMLKGLRGMGGAIAGGIVGLKGLLKARSLGEAGGIFGFLGKILGKKKDADALEKTAKKIPTIKDSFADIVSSLSGLIKFAGGVGIATITGVGVFKGAKSILKDVKQIVGILRGFDGVDWAYAKKTLVGIGGFLAGFAVAGWGVSKIPPSIIAGALVGEAIIGLLTSLASAFVALDSWLFKKTFENLKDITQSLKEGFENIKAIGNIGTGVNRLKTLENAVKAYNNMLPYLLNIQGTGTNVGAKSRIVKSVSDMVASLKKTMEDLKNLPEMSEEDLETAKKKISDVITKVGTLYEELEAELKDDYVEDAENGNTFLANVAGMIKSIVGSASDFKAMAELDVDLEAAKTKISDVKTKMIQIYDEIRALFEEPEKEVKGKGMRETGLENKKFGDNVVKQKDVRNAENTNSIVGFISQMISSIKSVADTITGVGDEKGLGAIDLKSFQKQVAKITGEDGVIAQLKTMYDQLISEENGFGGESEVDLSAVTNSFNVAISNIKNAVTGIQEIGAIDFEGEGGINSVVTSIKNLITNLKNAFNAEAIAGLQAQVEAFKAQITAIKTSIESLGGEEGGINVDIVINHTITGDTETVEDLNDAHDAIKTARDAIKKLSQSINLSFPISVSITGVAEAVAKMNAAASKLRSARANLRSASGGGNVSAGAYTGGYLAGGSKVLYRASGGDIAFPGKPRGSDTIPLWASRGEFVHNRHAVDFFGIDFMRKINRLDMRGALNDLMTKAGGMASIGRHSVVNNTYNNNQKVIQNINTNSVDFAFKSASRFAGAF